MAFFTIIGFVVVSFVIVRFLGWDIKFTEFMEIFIPAVLVIYVSFVSNQVEDLKKQIEELKERLNLDE